MNEKMTWLEKVEANSMKSNMVSINNGNRKTGKGCLTLSFPTCVCREDAPCKGKGCYCLHYPQCTANVQGAYYRNLRLWNENKARFEQQVNMLVEMNGIPLFRWFDCGDFVDEDCVKMTIRVAEKNPKVNFLAYTKKYDLVNEVLDEGYNIPANYVIRFSYWDKNWVVSNPYNLPTAYVDFKESSLNPEIPKNAFICKGGKEITCSMCKVCFNKKVHAVKFHQH